MLRLRILLTIVKLLCGELHSNECVFLVLFPVRKGEFLKSSAFVYAEQKRLVFPEDFTADDKDGDGRISLREFLRVRFADFDAVDTDHDGMLSLDEVVGAYAKKSAK